jgi:hypothetical protein
MRFTRAVLGLALALVASCGGDEPGLSCVNDYVLDGERCIFRGYAAGDFADASTLLDGGVPADASVCDAGREDGSLRDGGCGLLDE